MAHKKLFKPFYFLLFAFNANFNYLSVSTELTGHSFSHARIRHARFRCLQKYPQAEIVNYTDTAETQCFLHCLLYKTGLMDLSSRGLDSGKFIDILENVEEGLKEDTCLEIFDFNETLSGSCSDSYRKLMGFRDACVELFEYTFNTNTSSALAVENSKQLGQSATEFCDLTESNSDIVAAEISYSHGEEEIPLLSQYKDQLECIFENIYYLDAYGRVDEYEIILSYQEAQEDLSEARVVAATCSHRANAKFEPDYLGNAVLELQKCLKSQSTAFDKVFKLRDETSRRY